MPIQDELGRSTGQIYSQKQMGQDSEEPAVSTPCPSSLSLCFPKRGSGWADSHLLKEIRKIYIDHGWGSEDFRREECRAALIVWKDAYGRKIVKEYDELMRKDRSPSPPDPLDEFSD